MLKNLEFCHIHALELQFNCKFIIDYMGAWPEMLPLKGEQGCVRGSGCLFSSAAAPQCPLIYLEPQVVAVRPQQQHLWYVLLYH